MGRKILAYGLLAVLWGAPILAALELGARALNSTPTGYIDPGIVDWNDLNERDAIVVERFTEGAGSWARERIDLVAADPVERAAHLEHHREAVVLTDALGKVETIHLAPRDLPESAVARRVSPGEDVWTLAETEEDQTALRSAVEAAVSEGIAGYLDARIELDGYDVSRFRLSYSRLRDEDDTVIGTTVTVSRAPFDEEFVRYNPHVRQYGMHLLETNALGWRDDKVVVPKPKGVYRILCIGGSATVDGPTNSLTYPAILEAMFRGRRSKDGVMRLVPLGDDDAPWTEYMKVRSEPFNANIEVINCGVHGMDSAKQLLRAEDYLALEPDLVIQDNIGNDLSYAYPGWFHGGDGAKRWLRHSAFLHAAFNRWLLAPREEIVQFLRDGPLAHVSELQRRFAEAGVQFAVLSFDAPEPAYLSSEERAILDHQMRAFMWEGVADFTTYRHVLDIINEELRRFCEETGSTYIPFAEEMEGTMATYRDIVHLRASGIADKAAIIHQALVEDVSKQAIGRPHGINEDGVRLYQSGDVPDWILERAQ